MGRKRIEAAEGERKSNLKSLLSSLKIRKFINVVSSKAARNAHMCYRIYMEGNMYVCSSMLETNSNANPVRSSRKILM